MRPATRVALCCLALSVLIIGCSENVPQREAREKLEQRVKEIERAEWKK